MHMPSLGAIGVFTRLCELSLVLCWACYGGLPQKVLRKPASSHAFLQLDNQVVSRKSLLQHPSRACLNVPRLCNGI